MALEIHKISLTFPKIEQYGGIADQLRRSSKSITANIVEGYGKSQFYERDFKKMLIYSLASCDETQLWLEMSRDLNYIQINQFNYLYNKYNQIGKMLYNFIQTKK